MRKLGISDRLATGTIAELLQEQAVARPDSLYAIFPDRSFTFAELDREARAWARALHAQGVRAGDHVATMMPNCAEWPPVYFGALYLGAVVVALNARYKRHELRYTLAHSRSKILITTDSIVEHVDYAELLADVLPGLAGQDPRALSFEVAPDLRAIVLCEGRDIPGMQTASSFLAAGAGIAEEKALAGGAHRTVGDTAAIIYTSGTTSNPKGCELTNGNLQDDWSTFARVVSLKAGETVWMPMPFFHTGGIGPMTTILANGAAFITQPYYDADNIVELVERHRAEHLYPGFPQYTLGVVEHPRFDRVRFSHVRSLLNVGPAAMQRHIQSLLPEGAVLLNLFGMTEGSGIVTFTAADAPYPVRAETAGLPPPHTDVRIVDPESGAICVDGTPGEIQFRGAGAFKAYYRDEETTRQTILAEGWVRTGDRGQINGEGYLLYLGRLKDMLKVGGENVAAAEIEAFIQGVPGVKLVQVVGMADERMGEVPVAFVERATVTTATTATIDERAVIAACEGQLARWKVPRRVLFVTEWPMSSTKVQKFRLTEMLAEMLAGDGFD